VTVEVVTGAALAAEAHAAHMQDWGFFDTFMIGFAVIALVVGGFIIFNTFSITVAQRTREFAMLRAIGAGRAQVVGSVLVESVGGAVRRIDARSRRRRRVSRAGCTALFGGVRHRAPGHRCRVAIAGIAGRRVRARRRDHPGRRRSAGAAGRTRSSPRRAA
jgi:hypothetical protein